VRCVEQLCACGESSWLAVREVVSVRAVESESESEGILGGVGDGRNFRRSRRRKEYKYLGGVGVGRNFR
jgi:hypothetical protein